MGPKTFLNSMNKRRSDPAYSLLGDEGVSELPRAFGLIAVQIDRGGRDGRVPQVIPHGGQFCTACQGVGRVRMSHPVRTGLAKLLSQHRVIVLDDIGSRLKKPSDHTP